MSYDVLLSNSGLYGDLMQVVATLGAIAIAIVIAKREIASNKRRLKREHTVDILLQMVTNKDLVDAALFLDEHDTQTTRVHGYEKTNENTFDPHGWDEDKFKRFIALLGFYEFVAIALKAGELDEEILMTQRRSRIVKTWFLIESFVLNRRSQMKREALYENFENLALRFETLEEKITRESFLAE